MKIFVANRGEIALRVIRTAREMGIATVVGYAEADFGAPFTRLADEAHALGGSTPEQTYLNAEKLLALAQRTNCDAVHPGYGFLSESGDFAQAVAAAGLTWIGPAPEVLHALGNKISAREIAERANVAVLPGTGGIRDAAEITGFVERWGYPVVVKRADGGGGRGITILRESADLTRLLAALGPEPRGVFVERFVETARHIETQCMRDAAGNFAVVSTRDCSVQRRNQKLIEEAPACGLTPQQEAEILASSRQLFDATNYVGIGTCEFLVDADSVYFLEVNPRLQVEHTVSEEISGLDLVREQITVASGGVISSVPPLRGHSIEFRITCEDPAQQMMPTQGTVARLEWPLGPGVRIDSGITCGDTIAAEFDSMVAKIIVTAPTRAAALARARRALREFTIVGIATPAPLYADVLDAPEYVEQTYSTRWFAERFLPTWSDHSFRAEAPAHGPAHGPARVPAAAATTAVQPASLERYTIEVDGKLTEIAVPAGMFSSATPQPTRPQPLRRINRDKSESARAMHADGDVRSPIQAIVVRACVEEGDEVAEGDLLVVLEAMKMESYVHAPVAGRVDAIHVAAGDNVTADAALVTIAENT